MGQEREGGAQGLLNFQVADQLKQQLGSGRLPTLVGPGPEALDMRLLPLPRAQMRVLVGAHGARAGFLCARKSGLFSIGRSVPQREAVPIIVSLSDLYSYQLPRGAY